MITSISLTCLLIGGCPPGGGLICTAEFVYGLNVALKDQTGNPVSGATLTLSEGAYSETMESLQAGEYVGAGERAGTYSLTIEAAGFATQTINGIVVESNVCHVTPVSRDVTLNGE